MSQDLDPGDHPPRFHSTTFQNRQLLVGGHGPPVVLMHELFGVTPAVRRFAADLAAAGFAVHLVVLEGPERVDSLVAKGMTAAKLCLSTEYLRFTSGPPSKFTRWLHELVAHIAEDPKARVGVIGMCFSGGFALAAATQPGVAAAVAAEPSWPPAIACWAGRLGLSTDEMDTISNRVQLGEVRVLGLSFNTDKLCPARRMDALANLGVSEDDRIIVNSEPGNPGGFHRRSHSVLTNTKPCALAGEQHLAEVRTSVIETLRNELNPAG